MDLTQQTMNAVAVTGLVIAMLVIAWRVGAFFVNNRTKCARNRKKIRLTIVDFNNNNLDFIEEHAPEYEKLREGEAKNLLSKFEKCVEGFEYMSAIYPGLEKIIRLEEEIARIERIERTAALFVFFFLYPLSAILWIYFSA